MNLVTGGAGFIGSHLVASLGEATVVDVAAPEARRVQDLSAADLAGVETVWHLAADPDVRSAAEHPQRQYQENVAATWHLLELMRKADAELMFTSSSTVYGDATVLPTPESYGPLLPISVYGATKLACEALIAGHAATYGLRALMFRFANVVGPGGHGVVPDFVAKLQATPERLEILGDGSQSKSYLHVDDTVGGMLHAQAHAPGGCHAFNLGSTDSIPVTAVADEVAATLGLTPEYAFTGGTKDGAGWTGDVKHMGLDISSMEGLGWRPKMTSREAVAATARALAT